MKVLMICTVELGKNGITTCILNYFSHLNSDDCKIDILAPNKVSETIRQQIELAGRRLYEVSARKNSTLKYFFELIRIIKKEKYDIVHVHGNSCTIAIELLAAKCAKCAIRIAHSHNTTCEYMKVHKILRPIFEMTCNGRFACGEEAGRWMFLNKSFVVIKNGIDLSNYKLNEKNRTEMRQTLGVAENDILLGHIGLFNFQKNHEFLLSMFLKLNSSASQYHLICLGDGEAKDTSMNYVKKYHREKYVTFTGNVENVIDYLQALDLLLLPSRYEGVPYVLVEAQAMGIPCIVSETVSKEADLSGHVIFLPLDENIWVKTIKEIGVQRYNNAAQIQKSGFDIQYNAEYLKLEYKHMLN